MNRISQILRKLIPEKLKYKLFLSFVIFLLLPFSLINLYNFNQMEIVMQKKISEQDLTQLEGIKRSLEDLMGIVSQSKSLIEQDSMIQSILLHPEQSHDVVRKNNLVHRLNAISNSYFLSTPQVYFTIMDFQGHVYATFTPKVILDYNQLSQEEWFSQVQKDNPHIWLNTENYVDESSSAQMLTLYSILKDTYLTSFGVVRISIDYFQWFDRIVGDSIGQSDYLIIDDRGEIILQSNPEITMEPDFVEKTKLNQTNGFHVDEINSNMLTYSHIPNLNWTIVKHASLDVLYKEINDLQQRFFITLFLLTMIFIIITFIISATVTRSLKNLQQNMQKVVASDLKIVLSEERYSGEFLSLSQSFNQMVQDMNQLIERLKMEERQKEAVRFQVLLSQMNPHFLLNTLNTIKSISLRNQDEEIHEICISLGKILETSLNMTEDLIYLKHELELVKAYAHIQNKRLRQNFEIDYQYEDNLQYALIPKFSLQPLVENAIYHGFSQVQDKGAIIIRVHTEGKTLVLEIEDNGLGIQKANQIKSRRKRAGIGLQNIKERLELLFKSEAKLTLIPLSKGTLVRIRMPLLLSVPFETEGGTPDVDGFIGRR